MVSWVSALIGLAVSEPSDESDRGDRSPPGQRTDLNPRYDDKSSPVCVEPRLVIPRVEMWATQPEIPLDRIARTDGIAQPEGLVDSAL